MEKQAFNQEPEQLTYTEEDETEDQRTYTVDSETVVRETSDFSTAKPTVAEPELTSVCACLLSGSTESSEETSVSKRKRKQLSITRRTETYLRERRIPDLIRYMTAKILCSKEKNVAVCVSKLLTDCMTFRAGYGKAPVLFEERHLKAVIKSFDPNDRGWLTAGQVRRAFTTLGLTPKSDLELKTPTQEVLDSLRETQERELLSLLSAGSEIEDEFDG